MLNDELFVMFPYERWHVVDLRVTMVALGGSSQNLQVVRFWGEYQLL